MASTSRSAGVARRVRRSVAWHRFKEYVNGALWVLPTAAALLALAAGYVMSQVSHDPTRWWTGWRSRAPGTTPARCSSRSAAR
jgi:uncharacterized membrane protein